MNSVDLGAMYADGVAYAEDPNHLPIITPGWTPMTPVYNALCYWCKGVSIGQYIASLDEDSAHEFLLGLRAGSGILDGHA